MKLIPVIPQYELPAPEADFESALHIERWRVGEKAFYHPAGFGKYSPLRKSSLTTSVPWIFPSAGSNSKTSLPSSL